MHTTSKNINTYYKGSLVKSKCKLHTNINNAVESEFNLPHNELLTNKSTFRRISVPRQIALFLEHKQYFEQNRKKGWSVIGRKYGIDHKAVVFAVRKCKINMECKAFKKRVYDIQVKLYGKVKYLSL